MTRFERGRDVLLRFIAVAAVVAALIGCAAFLTVKFNRFSSGRAMRIETALLYENPRPYGARVLVPLVCNTVASALSKGIAKPIERSVNETVPVLRKAAGIKPRFIVPWVVMLGLHFGAYLGLLLCFRRLLVELYGASRLVSLVGAVFAGLAVQSLWIKGARFFYDPPSLFFGALLVLLIVRKKDWLFLAALIVATLNKETAAVYIAVWGICNYCGGNRRQVLGSLATQIAAVAIVRFAVIQVGGLDGVDTRYDNFIRDYWDYNRYHFAYAKFWTQPDRILTLLLTGVVLTRKWSTHPLVIRASFLGMFVLFLGSLRGGVWGEIRVFSDVYVPLALAATVNVVAMARADAGPASLAGFADDNRPGWILLWYLGLCGLVLTLLAGAAAPKLTNL